MSMMKVMDDNRALGRFANLLAEDVANIYDSNDI